MYSSAVVRKVLIFLLGAAVLLVGAIAIAIFLYSEAKPDGQAGPDADALARKMIASTQPDAWRQTGAIQWNFAGRFMHLWDRKRGFDRVTWGPYEVFVRLSDKTGVAYADGTQIEPERAKGLVDKAYARWVNDSFWLYPFDGVFDETTTRARVALADGGHGLLVTYGGGGLTPGDSYLWMLDDSGRPTAWKMWVSIIPVGGLEFSWQEWRTVETGAAISTLHSGVFDLRIDDLKAAPTLEGLTGGKDPFAAIATDSAAPSSQPASRPAGSATQTATASTGQP